MQRKSKIGVLGLGARMMAGASIASTTARYAAEDRERSITADQFEVQQRLAAEARKHQAKASVQAAARELVEASHRTVVLSHIHPRWLRRDVTALLDAGQDVTWDDIELLRKAGAQG